MYQWFSQLDRLLRGEATHPDVLQNGEFKVPLQSLCLLILLLGAIYGVCMGSFSLLKEIPAAVDDPSGRYFQVLASAVKVPLLFYLTLLVTFPSLYVFNALVGSRLSFSSVLQLLIASLAVNLAVLASMGPIVMFFSLSTSSYAFIKLLNVALFTVAGVLGLTFLLQTLHRLTTLFARQDNSDESAASQPDTTPPEDAEPPTTEDDSTKIEINVESSPSALDMPAGQVLARHTRLVFGSWVFVFALVGAQMGWVLRPFIGNPEAPFTWFRERQSNFFEAVLRALGALFS